MYYNSSLSLVVKPIRIHYVQKIQVALFTTQYKINKVK